MPLFEVIDRSVSAETDRNDQVAKAFHDRQTVTRHSYRWAGSYLLGAYLFGGSSRRRARALALVEVLGAFSALRFARKPESSPL